MTGTGVYDPATFCGLTFHDAIDGFRTGTDTPRDYLERCLATIAEKEPEIQALAAVNEAGARAAADASSERWKSRAPLSAIDGMPIGIKDLLETKDMPTQMGCEAFRGNFPKRDNAAAWALRQAGAVILAKTVTAELGGSHPGPTRNPFNTSRSPGGSSSGSAAAVAAGMMPAAIGTQVAGSIIRPAGYCGNVALKPSQGAINRGERLATSMSTHGVHANCIEDMWQVAIEIASRAGGDRGSPALSGPSATPGAVKPERLMVLETDGWQDIDDATRSGFGEILHHLSDAGVTVLRRGDLPLIESLEHALAGARETCLAITAWENRWTTRNIVDEHPDGVSPRARSVLASAEAMTPADYQHLLFLREVAQQAHRAAAGVADAIVTLSCPGPAPVYNDDRPGSPQVSRPTGDPVFNCPSSMLFAPAVTVPMMAIGGFPVGIQFMGQPGEDVRMAALACWMHHSISPISG